MVCVVKKGETMATRWFNSCSS